jgi:hypothetical protein
MIEAVFCLFPVLLQVCTCLYASIAMTFDDVMQQHQAALINMLSGTWPI